MWVVVHFLVTALPAGADPSEDDIANSDQLWRAPVHGIARSGWPPCLHRDLQFFGNVVSELAEVVQPIYAWFKTEFPFYHLHEAVQRILLNEICQILDRDADVVLDVHRRRRPLFILLAPFGRYRNTSRRRYH
ncbi:hypothetical protein EXIGLDRAFT_733791 [Exidia glandulosa HHB12029]|uniref:Secreted protein n=1 Tax=Exidia glandulosa HHB12029 TaxID=1314781 RepID=A0A165B7T5_EXIGL|nr:hypothetical protein EXIGLDRAFT_733791 [Exidia glandulosa HHB12029]